MRFEYVMGVILTVFVTVFLVFAVWACLQPSTHDTYCGPGWNSTCIELPPGSKPVVKNGCIYDDDTASRICGSWNKE